MIATAYKKPIGETLLDTGVITQEQLDEALGEQERSGRQKLLGELLVEQGACTDEQITEALAASYGMPFARVGPKLADPRVIPSLPREFLERNEVLPLFLVRGVLTVAISEPANVFLAEELERLSGHEVQLVAATSRDIRATLQAYLPNDQVFVIDEIIEEVTPDDFELVEQKVEDIANLERAAGDSPVIKLVNYIIYNAVRDGASDVHIEPGDNTLRVRYRVDGRLLEKLRPPTRMQAAVVSRIKIMAQLDISERRLPQDGGIHVMMEKRPIDLRISTMPGKYGEKVVIRVIDNDKASIQLEKLGFGYETLKLWRRQVQKPNGILLVTGPTGSGKSTTLYASLQELNADDVNICTVEDPIEYALAGVNQFQVNDRAGFTFANALRAMLRQDPDIMMVGEVRDGETARLATQSALTGHLVLSTLHTNDAPSAVVRLINLGIEPYLVAATVNGVLAQRLVRKLCEHCKRPAEISPQEARQLQNYDLKADTLYKPHGCDRCRGVGFVNRIGIYELFAPDETLVDAITNNASLNELRQVSRERGMRTLRADGMEKVASGVTTMEEVFRVTA